MSKNELSIKKKNEILVKNPWPVTSDPDKTFHWKRCVIPYARHIFCNSLQVHQKTANFL